MKLTRSFGGKGLRRAKNLALLWRRERLALAATPAEVVHSENKWRLLRYTQPRSGPRHTTPIVCVPSLINRHYVMDLSPGRSLVEDLVRRGHDVYMVDWGTPGDEDRHLSFDAFTDTYLGRAVRLAARASPRGKAHLFGYCLGGTLAVIQTALHPEHVASLTALAAPVRFRTPGLLSSWTQSETFDVEALTARGNVPWPLLQASFHLLRPTLSLSKTVHLVDKAWDDEYLDGFLALETWGNDNVAFPARAYREYVERLYRDDALYAGDYTVHGRPARLDAIDVPTLVLSFQHDNIVPGESAAALATAIRSTDKKHLHLPGGHVGAVVSRKASTTLWPLLATWFAEHDSDTDPRSP